ncbi:C-type lectin LmsL-like [Danio rerio]|uniref:C-type lectin LmsL-like n=1 Tax=Danio rerio TaxID=7955 RepID=A0AC58G2P1_DANRE
MRADEIFVLLSALSSCVNSHLFFFISENMTWPEAQTYCRLHYTDLATANDQADYDELINAVPQDLDGSSEMWIGLYRKSANAAWIWSDKSLSKFRLWGYQQPNNYLGQQFCVGTSLDEQWNDLECTNKFPSVCYSVKKRNTARLELKSTQRVNDPVVKADILMKMKQKLEEKGLPENATLSWEIQPDGNVFQKSRKSDDTQQPCLKM